MPGFFLHQIWPQPEESGENKREHEQETTDGVNQCFRRARFHLRENDLNDGESDTPEDEHNNE